VSEGDIAGRQISLLMIDSQMNTEPWPHCITYRKSNLLSVSHLKVPHKSAQNKESLILHVEGSLVKA